MRVGIAQKIFAMETIDEFIENNFAHQEKADAKIILDLALKAGSRFYIVLTMLFCMLLAIAFIFESLALAVLSSLLVCRLALTLYRKKNLAKFRFDEKVAENPEYWNLIIRKLTLAIIKAKLIDNEIFIEKSAFER